MKSIRFIYSTFQACFSLLFWVPVFYEYQKKVGLSDLQIFQIQGVYYAAFCFFEIPTGWLADRLGRRQCMQAGSLLLIGANLFPVFLPTYLGFLSHWVLIALSRSMISGASSAYLYDYLSARGEAHEYKNLEGTARAWSLGVKVISWIGIGSLMRWSFSSPYWLSAISGVLAWFFSCALPVVEISSQRPKVEMNFTAMTSYLRQQPILSLLMVQGVAIFVLVRICQVNLFQPLLASKSFGLGSYGMIMSLITVFEAVGSMRTSWVRRWLSDLNAVFALTVVLGAALLMLTGAGKIGTLIFLALFSYGAGLAFPIQKQLLNDAIPYPQYRATLLSVESILDRAVCAVVALSLGAFLQAGKMNDFIIYACMGSVLATGIVLLSIKALSSRRSYAT